LHDDLNQDADWMGTSRGGRRWYMGCGEFLFFLDLMRELSVEEEHTVFGKVKCLVPVTIDETVCIR
jgi:hypothetical protein